MKTKAFLIVLFLCASTKLIAQPQTEDDLDLNDVLKAKLTDVIKNGDFGKHTTEMRSRIKNAYNAFQNLKGINPDAKLGAFKLFESGIAQGMGKSILPKNHLNKAKSLFPGKDLADYRKRFKYLVQRMESETEDE